MAMAARRERGLLDPDAPEGESLFDHTIWCFASDGDLEEGVSGEASSLAGTQQLGNLVLVYDDNKISIEDDTNVAFTEDVGKRYEAYGWHVQRVDDGEDLAAVDAAFAAAKAETGRPSIIVLKTIIGWPAPNKQNTGAAHGSALGDDEVKATKKILGLDPEKTFDVAPEVIEHARKVVARGQKEHAAWQDRFDAWKKGNAGRRRPAGAHDDPHAARGLGREAAQLGRRPEGRRHAQGLRRGPRRALPGASPSCGAARPTWRRATTPPSRANRRSFRPTGRRRCGPAAPTAARCTSVSASTRWARS